jgi:hypothetical protein
MEIAMDTMRRLIIGYDLCDDFTQICCYSYKSHEPIPISTRDEDERGLIPTVLCFKNDTKQWLFGEEAEECSRLGLGTRIDRLLELLSTGKELELQGQRYSAVALLEQYLRKTLFLVKKYFPTEPVTKLVVTLRSTKPSVVEGIYAALAEMGLHKDRVAVISHARAYLYYALCQEQALWRNDVGLFDFSPDGMLFYQIQINRRQRPILAGLKKTDFTDRIDYTMLQQKQDNLAYLFETIAASALYKQLITTLYFTGNGFEGNWAEQVIKRLCSGRRVFIGYNLFSKGACYAAKELSGDKSLDDFMLLDDEMITSSVGVRVYLDTKFQEILLAQPGEVWYEVNKSIEVIPEGEPDLEIILKNVMSRELVREKLHFRNLPDRPDRMTRLEINLTCKNTSTGIIRVNDLGFGDFYPETGCIMEFSIEI